MVGGPPRPRSGDRRFGSAEYQRFRPDPLWPRLEPLLNPPLKPLFAPPAE